MDLVQPVELHRLAHEIGGAQPETARTGRSGRKSTVAADVAEVDLVLDHENPHRWHSSTIGAEPAKPAAGRSAPRGACYTDAPGRSEGGKSCRATCPCSSSPRSSSPSVSCRSRSRAGSGL